MTLNDLFTFLSGNPVFTIAFLVLIPVLAGVSGILLQERSEIKPWSYFNSVLLYLICIPGIFAFTLLVYSFLFEHRSIYDVDLITHVLPIISMIFTILLMKRNTDLDKLPWFGKLTGLIMMIASVLIILWVVDRTRLIIFSSLRIQYAFLILIALLLAFRYGLKKVF